MQCRPQASVVAFALDRIDQNVVNIDAFPKSVECEVRSVAKPAVERNNCCRVFGMAY